MASQKTKSSDLNWYARLSGWNNRIIARLLLWKAAALSGLARGGPGRARASLESAAGFCRELARYIVQTETLRLMTSPEVLKKALLETCGFTFLLTLTVVVTLRSLYAYPALGLAVLTLLVIILCLVFTHLVYLLALSGNVYQAHKDEAQQQLAHQASTTTLRTTGWLLVALCLGLALLPAWRPWVALDLGTLLLLARMFYLARLAQLRWSTSALVASPAADAPTIQEEQAQ